MSDEKKFVETATIELKKYNELRDFKKNLEEDFVLKIHKNRYEKETQCYISTEDAVLEIAAVNEGLMKDIQRLTKTNDEYFEKGENLKIELSKMSIWEFIKWRHYVS
jgi:hypothetical protein